MKIGLFNMADQQSQEMQSQRMWKPVEEKAEMQNQSKNLLCQKSNESVKSQWASEKPVSQ